MYGLTYSFGNAGGCIFADCEIVDWTPDATVYESACRISPFYSDDDRFRPCTKADLQSLAAGVKESWKKFIGA